MGLDRKIINLILKTSMYYYEDTDTQEIENIKAPELKEFDTFVEFDVKKSN